MTKYSDIEIHTAKNLLKNGFKWIGRNQSGRLSAHAAKPRKVDTYWWSVGNSDCTCDYVPIFQSVRFGDKEPTSLESIVHPQILDEVEKKYLSAVIAPFNGKVTYIGKVRSIDIDGYCYIKVEFDGLSDDMKFPLFREDDMYKGMKPGHAYTLQELGLYENDD